MYNVADWRLEKILAQRDQGYTAVKMVLHFQLQTQRPEQVQGGRRDIGSQRHHPLRLRGSQQHKEVTYGLYALLSP